MRNLIPVYPNEGGVLKAEPFDQVTTKIAREAKIHYVTLRGYMARGEIPFITLDNGVNLLQRSAAEKARKLKARNLTRVGRPRKAVAAAT